MVVAYWERKNRTDSISNVSCLHVTVYYIVTIVNRVHWLCLRNCEKRKRDLKVMEKMKGANETIAHKIECRVKWLQQKHSTHIIVTAHMNVVAVFGVVVYCVVPLKARIKKTHKYDPFRVWSSDTHGIHQKAKIELNCTAKAIDIL